MIAQSVAMGVAPSTAAGTRGRGEQNGHGSTCVGLHSGSVHFLLNLRLQTSGTRAANKATNIKMLEENCAKKLLGLLQLNWTNTLAPPPQLKADAAAHASRNRYGISNT